MEKVFTRLVCRKFPFVLLPYVLGKHPPLLETPVRSSLWNEGRFPVSVYSPFTGPSTGLPTRSIDLGKSLDVISQPVGRSVAKVGV